MGSRNRIVIALTAALVAGVVFAGVAAASSDPIVGTWHQRDLGHSNIFYFVDEPVGGVYPVLFYDDATGTAVCGDNGPMLWNGFLHETDANTYEGSFGKVWCPDNGDGVSENDNFNPSFTINYDPNTDTISGGIGGCVGERQQKLDNPNEAAEEIAEGNYPPPVPLPVPGCDE